MNRLQIIYPGKSEKAVTGIYADLVRRCAAAPAGNCPVEQCAAFLKLCASQSCGKCTPCRVGLDQMSGILDRVVSGTSSLEELAALERLARTIYDSADCAIGTEAAGSVLEGLKTFRQEFQAHAQDGHCSSAFTPVSCESACPAHVNIPGYIALVREGRFADAVRLIRYDNPFPSVCALVCEHPCEQKCRRKLIDDAVNIRAIKRMAVDNAGEVPPPQPMPASSKSVAVVGSGPAGLTAAYYLQLMGHQVTVYEQRAQLGGMLRYGIPRYRLPDIYLDRDIAAILSTGVHIRANTSIDGAGLQALAHTYDAVFLAIGAHSYKALGIEGEDAGNVISAVTLLRAIGDGEHPDFTGKRVVIVGGGNVAMDCTRTAVRLGAREVKCVYRRRQSDMTALPEEIEAAIAETCEVVTMMAPTRIEKDADGNIAALLVQPQIPGAYERGRPKPVRADRQEQRIACDILITAIGQEVDSGDFAQQGIPVKWGNIQSDMGGVVSETEGIFSGGDCVSGPSTVIRAVEAGKTAAANIDAYLGFHNVLPRTVEVPPASTALTGPCGRINLSERSPLSRRGDFEAVELSMTEQESRQECARCLRCDHYGFGAFRRGRTTQW